MYAGFIDSPHAIWAEREARMHEPLTLLPTSDSCLEHQALSLLNTAQSAARATKPSYEERLRDVARLRGEAVKLVGEDGVLTLLEEHRFCLLVAPDPCDVDVSRPRLGFAVI